MNNIFKYESFNTICELFVGEFADFVNEVLSIVGSGNDDVRFNILDESQHKRYTIKRQNDHDYGHFTLPLSIWHASVMDARYDRYVDPVELSETNVFRVTVVSSGTANVDNEVDISEKQTVTDEDQPCLVIRCTKTMKPEELDDLYNKILEQKKNGVILLPEFCAVITDNANTEYKVLMNIGDVSAPSKERRMSHADIQN